MRTFITLLLVYFACSLQCGDGVVNPQFEECDEGENNGLGECLTTCMRRHEPSCGDGYLDVGEECDDGNSYAEDDCFTNCTKTGLRQATIDKPIGDIPTPVPGENSTAPVNSGNSTQNATVTIPPPPAQEEVSVPYLGAIGGLLLVGMGVIFCLWRRNMIFQPKEQSAAVPHTQPHQQQQQQQGKQPDDPSLPPSHPFSRSLAEEEPLTPGEVLRRALGAKQTTTGRRPQPTIDREGGGEGRGGGERKGYSGVSPVLARALGPELNSPVTPHEGDRDLDIGADHLDRGLDHLRDHPEDEHPHIVDLENGVDDAVFSPPGRRDLALEGGGAGGPATPGIDAQSGAPQRRE